MFAISNSLRADLIKMLSIHLSTPGTDTKSANLRRKAKLAITKLNKSKQLINGRQNTDSRH